MPDAVWTVGAVAATIAAAFAVAALVDPELRWRRAYAAEIRRRPPVPDAELFDRFFAGSDVPPDVPARVRRLLAAEAGYPADKVLPDDDFTCHWCELDGRPFLDAVEREFGVRWGADDVARTPATVRGVSRFVTDARRTRRCSGPADVVG